jgi:hypothetical protein
MRYRIDAGHADANVALGMCLEPGCESVRLLSNSRAEALERLARHEAAVHTASKSARANVVHLRTA